MRATVLLLIPALVLGILSCSSEEPPCTPPDGCLAASQIAGRCQCLDWKIVSDQVAPLKFLVTGVAATPPGNQSEVAYGQFLLLDAAPTPPTEKSQLGSRFRAVLRDGQGKRTVLAAEVPSAGQGQYTMTLLGASTLSVALSPGNGLGFSNAVDVYPPAAHKVMVWVNPTLRMVTDAGGQVRGVWGWSGTCFWPTGAYGGMDNCSAPQVLMLDRSQVDGSGPAGQPYEAAFLATLEPSERSFILGYDRLAGDALPTAAELDANPRYLRLGELRVDPDGSQAPVPSWTPCQAAARDGDFPVYATTEIPISATQTLLIEQSWLSSTVGCTTQQPGLVVGTSTARCTASAVAYVDRMFGTLAFLPETVDPACTRP